MERALALVLSAIIGCFAVICLCGCAVAAYLLFVADTVNQNIDNNQYSELSGSKTSSNSVGSCASKNKTLIKNPYITAVIAEIVDPGKPQVYTAKRVFNQAELVNYSFGILVKDNPEGYYVQYELCDSNDKSLTYTELKKIDGLFYEQDPNGGAISSSIGNATNFAYTDSNGTTIQYFIKSIGSYSVNVFAATKDGSWEYVDTLKFDVTN